MLMKDEGRKKGMVALILKKMSGGSSYDKMKEDNENISERLEEKPMKDGAEQEYSMGLDSASEEMVRAFEAKDPKALKVALKSFIEMCLHEQD